VSETFLARLTTFGMCATSRTEQWSRPLATMVEAVPRFAVETSAIVITLPPSDETGRAVWTGTHRRSDGTRRLVPTRAEWKRTASVHSALSRCVTGQETRFTIPADKAGAIIGKQGVACKKIENVQFPVAAPDVKAFCCSDLCVVAL